MSKFVEKRRLSRQVAFQCLFAWHVGGNAPQPLLDRSLSHVTGRRADAKYAQSLVDWVVASRDDLSRDLTLLLTDHGFDELTLAEQVIMLLGASELSKADKVPVPVVLNEAVELCHAFGASEGYRMINAVLERYAQRHRPERKVS